jgi:uncharacterized protein with PIN domain
MEPRGRGEVRFLLDGSLGRLGRSLRMFGIDAEMDPQDLHYLIGRAQREGRILLTRRAVRPERIPATLKVIRIKEDHPERQVVLVLKWLGSPIPKAEWFSRCLLCNRLLEEVPSASVEGIVPDHVLLVHSHFRLCGGCGRVYWPGTHRANMEKRMERWAFEAWGDLGGEKGG